MTEIIERKSIIDCFKIYGEHYINNVKIKNIIPIDIYNIICNQGFRPIKMIHSNSWATNEDLSFDFVLCKNINENIFYYDRYDAHIDDEYNEYFLFFDHKTHYFLDRIKNRNNKGLNENLPRFCCYFTYNNNKYEIIESSSLLDNSFIINKINYY